MSEETLRAVFSGDRYKATNSKVDVVYVKQISREDAKCNPRVLFIFGDNDARVGFGGLAKELRGEPNTVGIRVKKEPSNGINAYYDDKDLKENGLKIAEDINEAVDKLNSGRYSLIIFPIDGIGTGRADMKNKCPETFSYMNILLEGILNIRNKR